MVSTTCRIGEAERPGSRSLGGKLCLALVMVTLATGYSGDASASSLKTTVSRQQWSLGLTDGSDFHQGLASAQLRLPRINDSQFSLSAFMPYAWTEDKDAQASLSGVGDAQVRGTWKSRSSRWALTAGLDLPTGKNPLSANEYIVATRILASRVLDFQFKRPGEGFDLMASVAHSIPVGRRTVLGFAAAGFLKGDYDVVTDAEGSLLRTAPGNRVHLSASLLAREHDRNPDWDLQTNLVLQIGGSSNLNQGSEEFEVDEGLQGTLDVAYGHRVGRSNRLNLYLYLLGRDVNQVNGQELLAVEVLGIGTRFVADAGASFTRPLGETSDLTFGAAHTVYRIESAGGVNSRITSFQLQLQKRWLPGTVLAVDGRFGVGNTPWTVADQPDTWERRDLHGWSFGLSTQFNW